jgi:hypothetical protein
LPVFLIAGTASRTARPMALLLTLGSAGLLLGALIACLP